MTPIGGSASAWRALVSGGDREVQQTMLLSGCCAARRVRSVERDVQLVRQRDPKRLFALELLELGSGSGLFRHAEGLVDLAHARRVDRREHAHPALHREYWLRESLFDKGRYLGSSGERARVVTATARNLPDCRCGDIAKALPIATVVWPEARSTHMAASPL